MICLFCETEFSGPSTHALGDYSRSIGFCRWMCWDNYEARKRRLIEERKEWEVERSKMLQKNHAFYTGKAWRELRYKILKKYGTTCMACGRTPDQGIEVHVDHIHPRSIYPDLELDPDNLQVLCIDCNFGKSNQDQTDFRPKAG